MSTSVRLDTRSEALLKQLARQRGSSKSDVLRDAISELASRELEASAGESAYAAMSDVIGIARGGPSHLAREHKRAFADALARRRRR